MTTETENSKWYDRKAWPSLIKTNDYYPFGLAMNGRTSEFAANDSYAYRYGFNGKEKDPEGMGGGGSTYDYGFRIYNPRIAKFLSVDPLTKSYPMLTPYQFASNRPIDGIDLDGLEYLRADEAKIEMIYGTVFIKLDNFSKVFQNMYRKDNPYVGYIFRNKDGFGEGQGEIGTPFERQVKIKTARLSSSGSNPNIYKDGFKLKNYSQSYTIRNRNVQNQNIISSKASTSPTNGGRFAGGLTLLVNGLILQQRRILIIVSIISILI